MFKQIIHTNNSRSTILIRVLVGVVFLSEGIQKFLYPASRGIGRFEGMGFPNPEFWANLVGTFEIVCGVLLLLGLVTRLAAFAMFVNISVAIIVTKIPIAMGHSFGPFILRDLNNYGFLSMMHEIRTDLSMWLGSLFLLIQGGGRWSLDYRLSQRKHER